MRTHHLLMKELGLLCMCAKWIPWLLMNEHKATRVQVCQEWVDHLLADTNWFHDFEGDKTDVD